MRWIIERAGKNSAISVWKVDTATSISSVVPIGVPRIFPRCQARAHTVSGANAGNFRPLWDEAFLSARLEIKRQRKRVRLKEYRPCDWNVNSCSRLRHSCFRKYRGVLVADRYTCKSHLCVAFERARAKNENRFERYYVKIETAREATIGETFIVWSRICRLISCRARKIYSRKIFLKIIFHFDR